MSEYLRDGPETADATLILAHGAGAPMDSPFMERFAQELGELGIEVVRFEFPYMQKRRETGKKSGPNTAKVLIQTWKDVISECRRGPLFIGGKSMGGRIASMVADEEKVDGLVCLGYPFHPPGKPDRLRTDHLKDLATPALFCQGTRDPFGKREETEGYDLSDTITFHWVPNGDHSFKPKKSSGYTLEQNIADAIEAVATFIFSKAES